MIRTVYVCHGTYDSDGLTTFISSQPEAEIRPFLRAIGRWVYCTSYEGSIALERGVEYIDLDDDATLDKLIEAHRAVIQCGDSARQTSEERETELLQFDAVVAELKGK